MDGHLIERTTSLLTPLPPIGNLVVMAGESRANELDFTEVAAPNHLSPFAQKPMPTQVEADCHFGDRLGRVLDQQVAFLEIERQWLLDQQMLPRTERGERNHHVTLSGHTNRERVDIRIVDECAKISRAPDDLKTIGDHREPIRVDVGNRDNLGRRQRLERRQMALQRYAPTSDQTNSNRYPARRHTGLSVSTGTFLMRGFDPSSVT